MACEDETPAGKITNFHRVISLSAGSQKKCRKQEGLAVGMSAGMGSAKLVGSSCRQPTSDTHMASRRWDAGRVLGTALCYAFASLGKPTHVYIHIRTVKNPHTITVIWRKSRTMADT